MSSSVTVLVAAAKFTGFGSSDCTFQPVSAQANCSRASRRHSASSGPQQTGICATCGLPSPPASGNISTGSALGSVAIKKSAVSPAILHEEGPLAATPAGTGSSGRSNSFAPSTSKYAPR